MLTSIVKRLLCTRRTTTPSPIPAIAAGRFVTPFSFNRMTWIKPSFLWLMERSGWGTKTNQTRILAVRIKRTGWDSALERGVLTSYDSIAHRSAADWEQQFQTAVVHVQWDPERSIHGRKLEHRAIQCRNQPNTDRRIRVRMDH
ncbi:MAG: DUF4291 family protein [Planctomycetaceae bacterium]